MWYNAFNSHVLHYWLLTKNEFLTTTDVMGRYVPHGIEKGYSNRCFKNSDTK